jgi:hypothetical protein
MFIVRKSGFANSGERWLAIDALPEFWCFGRSGICNIDFG